MADATFQQRLEEYARWFHQHPEASYHEFQTTNKIRGILDEAGIDVLDSGLETGLIARIDGTASSQESEHVVAIRGDIDGLPIEEDTGLPYASVNKGFLHGCGHDYNMTVALGAALWLHERRHDFAGTVKVIFQPAEEVSADKDTPTGAVAVLNTGMLDDVEAFFGTHDTNLAQPGECLIGAGPQSGAVDKFHVTVRGDGSHAARPHLGISPIRPAIAIVDGIETISSKTVDPTHPRAISITHIEAGSTWNVIPSEAFLEGTVRTAYSRDRVLIHDRIQSIVNGVALAYGVAADFDWEYGSPAVTNDETWTGTAREAAEDLGFVVNDPAPSLEGEDFSYYQDHAPGVFVYLGVGNADRPMHGGTFYPRLDALAQGACLLARIATSALSRMERMTDATKEGKLDV